MTWHLVADSSCDLFTLPLAVPDADFATIPFRIRVGDKEYLDDENMPIDEMLTANEDHSVIAQTACPSPQAWAELFSQPGPVLAFTISSHLSGSYNSACAAKKLVQDADPDKKVAVIDTKATGPETVVIIRKACDLIRQSRLSFEQIEQALIDTAARTHIIFALASYHNLIRNGRVSRLIGFVAGHLGFWGVGIGDDNGEIAIRGKARSKKHMLRMMADEIKKVGLSGSGEVVICHCQNQDCADQLKTQLREIFPRLTVDVMPTRGLDSFYAERHGLIVAF